MYHCTALSSFIYAIWEACIKMMIRERERERERVAHDAADEREGKGNGGEREYRMVEGTMEYGRSSRRTGR